MKYMIKKVASVLVSTALVGSTMGFAAAATYPQPFVEDGASNGAIVVGSGNAADSDMAAATDIGDSLSDKVTSDSTSGVSVGEGNSIQLKRSSDEFNLGDSVTDFYSNLDSDELGEILATGEYLNDQNDDFEYDQKLTLTDMNLTHFRDREYEDYEPTVGIKLAKDDPILNYTLDFTPNAAEGGDEDFSDIEDTFIEILGKEYYISKVSTSSGKISSITLLDSANSDTLNEGESTTMNVGEESYDVELVFIGGTDVKFKVDGTETNTLKEGDTYKLSDDSYIAVQEVLTQDYQEGTKQTTFSIGSGKIDLINGDEVEINSEAVSQMDDYEGYRLNANITNSSTDIDDITLEWLSDDDMFLTTESELVMPAFESIRLAMSDFIEGVDEKVTFGTGDPFSVTTDVEDGEVSIDLFYLNSSEDGFANNLGANEAQHLITDSSPSPTLNLNLENETYFVASWKSSREAETYVYELSNIKDNSGKNETTLENLADGSTVVFSNVDDTQDVGRLKLTLTAASEEDENASIKIEPISGGEANADRIFTSEGLQFLLPVITQDNSTNAGSQEIFLGNSTTELGAHDSWTMNFTEENVDGDIGGGDDFSITVSLDTDDGIEADSVDEDNTNITMHRVGRTGDDYIGYVLSDLGTRIDWTKDTSGLDSMEITYAGEEIYGEIYVTSSDSTTSETSSAITVVKDTEVSSVSDKNLVVVGGSCVNSVAATLLGEDYCGDDFTSETGVGSGEYLIATYASPESSSKIATLVAGYNAADTTNAANALQTKAVEIEEGQRYIGDSSDGFEEA